MTKEEVEGILQRIWANDPENEVAQRLSALAQQIYCKNAPTFFLRDNRQSHMTKHPRKLSKELLEKVIRDYQNPLVDLMGDGSKPTPQDVKIASWELRRRKFCEEYPNCPPWDLNDPRGYAG